MKDTSGGYPDNFSSSCDDICIDTKYNYHYAVKDKDGVYESLIPVGLYVVIALVVKLNEKENTKQHQSGNDKLQHPSGKIIFKLYSKK